MRLPRFYTCVCVCACVDTLILMSRCNLQSERKNKKELKKTYGVIESFAEIIYILLYFERTFWKLEHVICPSQMLFYWILLDKILYLSQLYIINYIKKKTVVYGRFV